MHDKEINSFKGDCIGYNAQNKQDQSPNIKSCEIPSIVFDTILVSHETMDACASA